MPYLGATLVFLNVVRVVLMIASYWKPGICRYYLYYQLLFFAVRSSIPGDNNTNYMRIMIFQLYIFMSTNRWGDMIASVLCFGHIELVVRHYIYLDERTFPQLLISNGAVAIQILIYCIAFYMAVSWIGFKFIEAEIQRIGNDELLQSLD